MLWQRLELDLPQGSWQRVWGGVSEEKGRRGETNGEGPGPRKESGLEERLGGLQAGHPPPPPSGLGGARVEPVTG